MAKGGARVGAGRKKGTGQYGEPTVSLRVPVSMVDAVRALLAGADHGEPTCPLISLPTKDKY